MNERGTQQGSAADMPLAASTDSFTWDRFALRILSFLDLELMLHRDPEAIQRVVVGGEESMSIADGNPGRWL